MHRRCIFTMNRIYFKKLAIRGIDTHPWEIKKIVFYLNGNCLLKKKCATFGSLETFNFSLCIVSFRRGFRFHESVFVLRKEMVEPLAVASNVLTWFWYFTLLVLTKGVNMVRVIVGKWMRTQVWIAHQNFCVFPESISLKKSKQSPGGDKCKHTIPMLRHWLK